MAQHKMTIAAMLLTLLLQMMGCCDSNDARLARFALEATAQQAHQNERIAEQSRAATNQSQELLSATHELVERDALARRELLQAHEASQAQIDIERRKMDVQREELHAERRSIATAAVREPLIAKAVLTAGAMLAALLPLIVTAYAIRRLPETKPANELTNDWLDDVLQVGTIRSDAARLNGATVPRLNRTPTPPAASAEIRSNPQL